MARRVLVVHPGAELYGSDRVLLEGVAGLVAAGDDVTVALPSRGPLVEALRTAGATVGVIPMLVLRKSLLRPRGWPSLIGGGLRGLGSAWRTITRVRPDVVYVSTITLPQWPLVSRLRGIPAVTHVHEGEAGASRLIKLGLYAPHAASSAIIANSGFSRDVLASAIPSLEPRTQVVHNAVPGPAAPRPPRDSVDDELRVLFIGRLSPRKGPDVAVRAVGLLRERGIPARLDVVGDVFEGYEWFARELEDSITDAGIGEHVTLHGFHTDVWPFLDAADVLVVPSRLDEPFGNTAVEGVLALRPVIVSDTSGLREAGGGYPTVSLVRPDDAEALADALEAVRGDWMRVSGATADAAATASARHSLASYTAALTSVLDRVTPPASEHA